MSKSILVLGASIALSACSLGGSAPKQLLSLSSTAVVPVDTQRTVAAGNTLTVFVPSAGAALSGTRIPVYDGGTAVAYVKDAVWLDTPARQFQRLLSETIAANSSRVVLDVRQTVVDPGTRLTGSLITFGIDASAGQAVVTFDAQRSVGREQVNIRRFESRVPVSTVDALNSAQALNRAANEVAVAVAAWVG